MSLKCLQNMKTVYLDEKNVVLDEKSAEIKTCINRESKSLELKIQLYACHDINMKFIVVVTPLYIYQKYCKLPPNQAETNPWDTLCIDLIGPYTIHRK